MPDHLWYAQQKGAKGKSKGGGGGKSGAGFHDNKVLMNFLKQMQQGWGGDSWGGSGKGWGKSGKKSSGGSAEMNELIGKIKDFQRSSEENKQAWWAYCSEHGGGNRDPARHDAASLREFLNSSGVKVGPKLSSSESFEKSELVNRIKSFQRTDEVQKQAWWDFCDAQENQKRDPNHYSVDVLKAFLAQYGLGKVQGTKAQKDALIERVKGFQKMGEEQKETWWSYVAEQGGKKRDPALYDIQFLEDFCTAQGI